MFQENSKRRIQTKEMQAVQEVNHQPQNEKKAMPVKFLNSETLTKVEQITRISLQGITGRMPLTCHN